MATGESTRFELLLTEYQRAPEVTRERLYLETMEQILGRTPKVMIGAENAQPLLYLPVGEGGGSQSVRMVPPADAALRDSPSRDISRSSSDNRGRGREGR